MFNLFRKNKIGTLSLETQIQNLKDLGLTFNESDSELIKQLTGQFNRILYEEDPYSMLISVAGSDFFDMHGNALRLSYDILSFDTECVEDENIYSEIITQFVRLTKGEIQLCDLDSMIDFDEKTAFVSFSFEGKKYEWDVSFDDDWFDVNVLERIATIVGKADKKFIYFNDGQHLTIMYCTLPTIKKLNNLTKNKFSILA